MNNALNPDERGSWASFHVVYAMLLRQLLDPSTSALEVNERTGKEVRVLRTPFAFALDLSDGRLPVVGTRRLFPGTAAAELAWFLSGETDLKWLQKYAHIWDKFVEPGTNHVEAAYGYRWRRRFGRDQLGDAIKALRNDPSDRRVYVSAWDPSMDGLGVPSRCVPCPIGFGLTVVDGELNLSFTLRSSDVFVGLPYDVMDHALLLAALARELGLAPGTLMCSIHHAHLYSVHEEMARTMLATPSERRRVVGPLMPVVTVGQIAEDPDGYVEAVRFSADLVLWPDYSPRPEVVL